MKIKIPKENRDVKAARLWKFLKQLGFIVIWCAVVTALAWVTGYLGDPIGMAFVELLWIFPFWRTKIWRWLTVERAYEGVVTEVKHENVVDSKTKGLPVMHNIHRQYVTVKCDNGKERNVKYETFDEKEQQPNYEVGDRVRHYYGAKFLHKIDPSPDAPNICVLCGTQNNSDAAECGFCGKSMIK